MKRVAIIGGGISGLAAAYTLEQLRRGGADLEYALYEAAPRLGGVIRTELVDGCVVEAGPDSFLTEKNWAADFCHELDLGDQLIHSNDDERKTYILTRGRLVSIPDGLMFLVPTKILPTALSPLFSWKTKLRMMRELGQSPRAENSDESVASLVERHYGAEMVDRLADPLLSGIYGGDAADLSVRAVMPRFAEMERNHGSLGRAMLAARKKNPHSGKNPQPPIFTSLRKGMQQIIDAVVARLNTTSLYTGTGAQTMKRDGESWTVSVRGELQRFDAVIVAVPTHAAAPLLAECSPELSRELAAIRYTSSITLALGFDRATRESLPPGFGFLVPRSEEKRLLATTFVHNKFLHRAPDDRALLRCFIGGENAERVWISSDEQIVDTVRMELKEILGLQATPRFARVYRWKAAMAQYAVGHLERLTRIEQLCEQIPGLALAGNGYRGIGVPDCIRSGREAAERIAG